MAGLDIASGALGDHGLTNVQPLQDTGSGITPVAAPPAVSASTGPDRLDAASYGAVLDTTAMFGEQDRAGTADCAAAMSAGMDARNSMLAGYQAQILPPGAAYGDQIVIPAVPEDATAPAADFLFAEGDQPGKGT